MHFTATFDEETLPLNVLQNEGIGVGIRSVFGWGLRDWRP